MRISPPVAILAFLAIVIAVTGWVTPPAKAPDRQSVLVSTGTYEKLKQWAEAHPGADGQPLTVAQVIDVLASQ